MVHNYYNIALWSSFPHTIPLSIYHPYAVPLLRVSIMIQLKKKTQSGGNLLMTLMRFMMPSLLLFIDPIWSSSLLRLLFYK